MTRKEDLLKKLDKIAEKSTLTEEDAIELGRLVRRKGSERELAEQERRERLDELAKHSKLTKADVDELDHLIKEAARKRIEK